MVRLLHLLTVATAMLVIWANPVWAGPAVVPFVIGIAKKVVISMVVSAVTNKIFGNSAKKKAAAAAAAASAVLVNKQSNNDAIPVVYGRRRMGGVRCYIESSDGAGDVTKTNKLNMVIALCEGEMGEIKRVYFNDVITWDVTDGGTTSGLASGGVSLNNFVGKYASSVEMTYHPGTDDQTVDAMIQNSVGSAKWSNDHRLRGVAYISVKLTADPEKYQGAAPVITVELEGKRIKNVATDVYYATSDQNPVDVLYDYLINSRYGKGLDTNVFDMASFIDSRAYAAPRYGINGFIDTGNQIFDNIEQIQTACNSNLIFTAGRYKLAIRRGDENITHSFSESNIIGPVELTITDVSQRINKITINYGNAAAEIAFNDDMVVVDNAGYLSADHGKLQEVTTTEPMVTNTALIETLANYKMNASRHQLSVAFEAAHTAFTVEAGDIVSLNIPELGFSDRPFRVLTLELTSDNTIGIIAQEYVASIEI